MTPSKLILAFSLLVLTSLPLAAEDGHQLWLRYQPVNKATVVAADQQSPTIAVARQELQTYYLGDSIVLRLDPTMPDDDGFSFDGITLKARRPAGLLYGAYAVLRDQTLNSQLSTLNSHPTFPLRLLNHWDNPDGTIERGYAGESIFHWFHLDRELIREYARANASIGINGTVLNNVNASPKMLTTAYLREVKTIADILRPYGIRVYLSINFATPLALGDTKTADPLNKAVQRWWQRKAREIYKLIPDFGGFLVKANSEGQPGPGDYHRTHAEGANMLADALKPYGGIVMWRCFVYAVSNQVGLDRAVQAVEEFKPLDGQFRPNVILQTKNGPVDFQPREPYSPIFDQNTKTNNMVELQVTQEYLGQSRHLVYLAPMWQEFFSFVNPAKLARYVEQKTSPDQGNLVGAAGVANIGNDRNWCGHHFSQANWYAFGRLAWDPSLSSELIAREWLQLTFTDAPPFVDTMTDVMLQSREACVNYMMPLGLHHLFQFDHHYGPEPGGYRDDVPFVWCPVYYHRANADSIGFDRTPTGSNAVSQYRDSIGRLYNDLSTCPDELLLWFHRVPWGHVMHSGNTLWEELQYRYNLGVNTVESFCNTWHNRMRPYVDPQRWLEVDERLQHQRENAREWRDKCLGYFASQQSPNP